MKRRRHATEQAATVSEVKTAAGKVLQMVWGAATGPAEGNSGEITVLGRKELWQVTGGEWSPSNAKRLATFPPKITDPRQLGVMGRGRAVRGRLWTLTSIGSPTMLPDTVAAGQV